MGIVLEYSLNEEESELLFSVDHFKTGDFILAKFQSCGKRASAAVNYRYVCVVSKVLQNNELEINSLKSVDADRKSFKYIENNVSVINISQVLRKLPEPELLQ